MTNLVKVDHPLLASRVSRLRDAHTDRFDFSRALEDASCLLTLAASEKLPLSEFSLRTPLEYTTGEEVLEDIVVVPILRAGQAMLNGFLRWHPDARVGLLGIKRNPGRLGKGRPTVYLEKLPDLDEARVFVLDPVLATGGSAAAAIDTLRLHGASNIYLLTVISAPPGLVRVHSEHPDVVIFTAAVDRELDDNFYIRPGLGDAGDRAFGTGGS